MPSWGFFIPPKSHESSIAFSRFFNDAVLKSFQHQRAAGDLANQLFPVGNPCGFPCISRVCPPYRARSLIGVASLDRPSSHPSVFVFRASALRQCPGPASRSRLPGERSLPTHPCHLPP
jgi:hypothetical protein